MPSSAAARRSRRRLLHRPWAASAVSAVAAAYLTSVATTTRWQTQFHPEALALVENGETAVAVFWHQRLLGIPTLQRRVGPATGRPPPHIAAMVSQHGDGELIAQTLGRVGIDQVRGSTTRGGAAAVRAARAAMGDGAIVAIVIDGPRGPHGTIHPGALFLARATGRPIVPVTFAVDRGFQAGSWDRMLVPLPFGRGRLVADAPISVPTDASTADLDHLRDVLARRLEHIAVAADESLGVARAGAARPLERS